MKKHDGAEELGRMSYDQYLRSPHWQRTRRVALSRAAGRCGLCGEKFDDPGEFDVHHRKRNYSNLGRERMADLLVVCRDCHRSLHPEKTGRRLTRHERKERDLDREMKDLVRENEKTIWLASAIDTECEEILGDSLEESRREWPDNF